MTFWFEKLILDEPTAYKITKYLITEYLLGFVPFNQFGGYITRCKYVY